MAKTTTPLRDSQIRNAKPEPGKTEKVLYDGDGLQIHLKANGSKLWNFRYRHPVTKKRQIIAFGPYPALSISSARELRAKSLSLLALELDPKFEREKELKIKARDHSNTFAKVADEFITNVKSKKVSVDHTKGIRDSLVLHVYPFVGNKPINQLEALDFIEALKPMEARGILEQLSRVCQRINEVMDYATNHGLIKYNPAQKISKVFESPKEKHFPTLDPIDLTKLMKTLAFARIERKTRALIEFELHTMARPFEAASAKWEHIDLSKMEWALPAEMMKMDRDFIVPLTPAVLAILNFMKDISGNREYVFPSRDDPNSHMNSQTANAALKRNGLKDELVAHGMRSIASTYLNEKTDKLPPEEKRHRAELIEVCLSHKENDEVRAAYNHAQYIEARRKILTEWSLYIEKSAVGFGTISMLNDRLHQ